MPDLSPIVEPLVAIVGIVLIVAATFALIANLFLDLWKLIRQAPPQGLDSATVLAWGTGSRNSQSDISSPRSSFYSESCWQIPPCSQRMGTRCSGPRRRADSSRAWSAAGLQHDHLSPTSPLVASLT